MKKTEKTYHENGNIHQEFEVNKKGERHGSSKIYHKNGELQADINFTNGIQDDGKVISYHDNGVKSREINRLNDNLNGEFSEWYKSGELKFTGTYSNGVPNILKVWNEDGAQMEIISMLVTFANTIFNGQELNSSYTTICENNMPMFIKIANNAINGEFEMPTELKNHIEVVHYNIDLSEAFSNGNVLIMDIDCIVTFAIKTTRDEAIKVIEEYQEDNDDLRWNLSIKWKESENNKIEFDSWDEDLLEDIIEDVPCWYEED